MYIKTIFEQIRDKNKRQGDAPLTFLKNPVDVQFDEKYTLNKSTLMLPIGVMLKASKI